MTARTPSEVGRWSTATRYSSTALVCHTPQSCGGWSRGLAVSQLPSGTMR
jgi:hypothetical protein